MAKYFVKEIKQIPQTILQRINSVSDMKEIKIPYEFKLIKKTFFGLIKKEVSKTINLPINFDPMKEIGKQIKYGK